MNELNHVKTFMHFRDRAAWSGCPRSIHLVAITPCRLDAFLPDMRHHLLVQRPVEIGFGDEAGAHAVRGQPFAGIDLQPRRFRPPAQDLPPSPDSGLYFERKQWDFTSLAVKKTDIHILSGEIASPKPRILHRRDSRESRFSTGLCITLLIINTNSLQIVFRCNFPPCLISKTPLWIRKIAHEGSGPWLRYTNKS